MFRKITWPLVAFSKLILRRSSYLRNNGWIESLKRGYPCRKDGSEIPWMNYPAIRILEERLNKKLCLFEFGSGYSTSFYAKKVNRVVSVEHNKYWYDLVKKKLPENVELIYQEKDIDGKYCRTIISTEKKYDVVVVDGGDRMNCLMQTPGALSERGVIILDDSQRKAYSDHMDALKNRGFRSMDFEGLKPMGSKIYKTTIFYRDGNCLNI